MPELSTSFKAYLEALIVNSIKSNFSEKYTFFLSGLILACQNTGKRGVRKHHHCLEIISFVDKSYGIVPYCCLTVECAFYT